MNRPLLMMKNFCKIFEKSGQLRINHFHAPFVRRSFAQYGGRHTVTLIPGDGIGPEVTDGVKQVFSCAGVPVDFEEVQVTSDTLTKEKLEEACTAIVRNEVAIKGNIETDHDALDFDQKSANVYIRAKLDLFANVIKVKSLKGIPTRHNNIDIRILRENMEGEYSALEHETIPGVVESLKIVTEKNSMRIAEFAFEYAKRNNRKHITAIHKANIMKLSDGLFLDCCRHVAKKYPEIGFDDMIVDNCNMQLVKDPSQFDVMVMPNLYGNIIGNVCCGLVGGAGVVGGANIGEKYRLFEAATRNTGSSIAGQNLANPCAMLFASTLMLKYLGLPHYATFINQAIVDTVSVDKIYTADIGGEYSTSDVLQSICNKVKHESANLRYRV